MDQRRSDAVEAPGHGDSPLGSVPERLHTTSRASLDRPPYNRRTNATEAQTNGQPCLTSRRGMGDSSAMNATEEFPIRLTEELLLLMLNEHSGYLETVPGWDFS